MKNLATQNILVPLVALTVRHMNQRNLLTVAALFTSVAGLPSVGRAQTLQGNSPNTPSNAPSDAGAQHAMPVHKMGEFQNPTDDRTDTAVTEIHRHDMGGRQAATLYIRNLPVLTFFGNQPIASGSETKVGVVGQASGEKLYGFTNVATTKVATLGDSADLDNQAVANQIIDNRPNSEADAVQRASVVAARINQLIRENVDASKITVSWKADNTYKKTDESQGKSVTANDTQKGRYVIKIDGAELVEINEQTQLANSTNNVAQDALQATNRLRRLIGNAQPINQIANLPLSLPSLPQLPKVGLPQLPKPINIAPVLASFRGIASFYCAGFHGNRTASGQRYNCNAYTAAHRSLPFGTRVRVTNVRNGRSVIVTINDRGPFIRGRIIDLSTAAARSIGMIGSGIAPVRVEVLGR